MKKQFRKIIIFLLITAVILSFSACSKGEDSRSMTLDNGNITVSPVSSVSGIFTERGGNDKVENVCAVTVRNNSGKMLEYGTVTMNVNGEEYAEFIISALPAGESVLVMESLARQFSDKDEFTLRQDKSMFSYCEADTNPKDVSVSTDGNTITVKNNTDEQLTALITYKYFKDGVYYGGIAFRGEFADIPRGESLSKTSERFNESCRIVNIVVDKQIGNGGDNNEPEKIN